MCRLRGILTAGLDQFFAQGFGNRFGLGMNLEFVVNVFQLEGDGMKRDAERAGGVSSVPAFPTHLNRRFKTGQATKPTAQPDRELTGN
jgi:hypothetical protein